MCKVFTRAIRGLAGKTKCRSLTPPIVSVIAVKAVCNKQYFKPYWTSCFQFNPSIESQSPYKCGSNNDFQSDNAWIHIEEGFINPFLLLHPLIYCNFPDDERLFEQYYALQWFHSGVQPKRGKLWRYFFSLHLAFNSYIPPNLFSLPMLDFQ